MSEDLSSSNLFSKATIGGRFNRLAVQSLLILVAALNIVFFWTLTVNLRKDLDIKGLAILTSFLETLSDDLSVSLALGDVSEQDKVKFAEQCTAQVKQQKDVLFIALRTPQGTVLAASPAYAHFDKETDISRITSNLQGHVLQRALSKQGQRYLSILYPMKQEHKILAIGHMGISLEGMYATLTQTGLLIGGVTLGVLLWVVFSVARFSKRIGEDLKRVTAVSEQMAAGVLTAEKLHISSSDEVGRLAVSFNRLIDFLPNAIQTLQTNARQLTGSAQSLNTISEKLGANAAGTASQTQRVSNSADQVNQNVQSVSATAEEMNANIKEITRNAGHAAGIAHSAVQEAEVAMRAINQLGTSSEDIGAVVNVITSIAEQTNLLALNATIEAARAGESGKGFAVVASEVKELAKGTAKATGDIQLKIQTIQKDTQASIAAIKRISETISKISDIQISITGAMEEQATTIELICSNMSQAAQSVAQIAQSMNGVAGAAQDTTQGAMSAQKAAAQLVDIANGLQGIVLQFTIKTKPGENVLSFPSENSTRVSPLLKAV
jgi:methyl-accepting chemotaxis protein